MARSQGPFWHTWRCRGRVIRRPCGRHACQSVPLREPLSPTTRGGRRLGRPLDGSLGHPLGQDRGLMAMARRQEERHELAVAFGTDVAWGTQAALTPAERVGVSGGCASGLWMRPDARPIHVVGVPIERAGAIRLLVNGRAETGPEARLPPAIKTAGAGAPGARALWQLAPGGAGAEEPQDTVSVCLFCGPAGICAGHDWLAPRASDRHAPSPAPHAGRLSHRVPPPGCAACPCAGVSRRCTAPKVLPPCHAGPH
jgi:hypothetical protein